MNSQIKPPATTSNISNLLMSESAKIAVKKRLILILHGTDCLERRATGGFGKTVLLL